MNRVLVAGIGNIFLGDDGFGCEVAQQLSRCDLPENVDVVDFGIRGMALGYALMDGYALAILIDTADRNGAPGTVYVIEPEIETAQVEPEQSDGYLISPHAMDPVQVLKFIGSLGDRRPRVLVVACQPETLGGEEGHMGLSTTVTAAVDVAVRQVQQLLGELSRVEDQSETEATSA